MKYLAQNLVNVSEYNSSVTTFPRRMKYRLEISENELKMNGTGLLCLEYGLNVTTKNSYV